jgi:hypothetical protein
MYTVLTGTLLVNTVADNKSRYTNRDYSRALVARQTQKDIGRPSTHGFIKIVENKQLLNCPVTRDDIVAAEDILGPDKGGLQGKTVHRKLKRVNTRVINIPTKIMSQYYKVTLCGDNIFVNKIPFFTTISRNIKFRTFKVLKNQKSGTPLAAIKSVKRLYMQQGFQITHLLMDGQFEPLRGDLSEMQIHLNVVSKAEHKEATVLSRNAPAASTTSSHSKRCLRA